MTASALGWPRGLFERSRLRVVIEAYFDDSGKESDHTHRFVVLAGYMAAEGLPWNRFYQAWRHLLLRHGLPHIHMKDILGIAQAKGWDIPKLNEVLREFIAAIKDAQLIGFGVAVDANEWRALSKERRKRFGDAQEFCCSRILRRIVDRLNEAGFPEEQISITFDRDWEFARRRLTLIEEISKRAPQIRRNLAQLSFADSEHFYPLQAADLLAWETRRELAHRIEGERGTARWAELMTALPYGELDYAAGEYWNKEWIDRDLPNIEAEHEAARAAALAAKTAKVSA
jgi:hypothetical protein